MRLLALIAALAPLPAAAQSDQTFSLPNGCTGYLTVQMRSCSVSHHFTCTGDPEGVQRRVDLDEDGITYAGAIDAETQWLESFHVYTNHSEALEASPADRASFTELTETGENSYDFQTESEEIGTTRYVGTDRLTGVTETIDGVTLEQTEYSIRAIAQDGTEMWRGAGNEYINRDWRMFLSGTGTVATVDDQYETDQSPVEFAFPGDPGFLALNPKFDCGVVMSSWSPE